MSLYPSFCPVTTVEIAVADGLGNVHGLDLFRASKVGNGAGDLQDAAVGTGRVFNPSLKVEIVVDFVQSYYF